MVSDFTLHLVLALCIPFTGWLVFAACLHPLSRPMPRTETHARTLAGGALVLAAAFLFCIVMVILADATGAFRP